MIEESINTAGNGAFIENLSPVGFDITVERLSEEIGNRSWKVSHVYDLKKTLANHEKTVLPVKIFSICSPKHSGRILDKDAERIISPLMPCRVSVYKKSDGKTYISRMNSLMMSSGFTGLVRQVMLDSAGEVEEMIEKTIQTG